MSWVPLIVSSLSLLVAVVNGAYLEHAWRKRGRR